MNIFWLASRKRECFRDAFFRARGAGGGRHGYNGYSGNPGDTGTCGGQTSPTHTAGFFSPLVALCAPRLPALGCRYVLRVCHLNTGLTPCALLCRPYGAVTGKGSPLVKSRSDEARASLSGYVTDTMWYIVSTLCGDETVIYG